MLLNSTRRVLKYLGNNRPLPPSTLLTGNCRWPRPVLRHLVITGPLGLLALNLGPSDQQPSH